ncbi:PHP domain-containing protein [Candidatus Thorarchaeota archaeon]|nr:MAG: PHP domain-containing protein [Candidatus Thorarchaeota archaeon]
MVKALADLHVHSNVSDGLDSPADLVEKAVEKDIGGIALTDHDILDGNAEFMECSASRNLQRVPGVEVSTEHDGYEAHILGYFVHWGPSSLRTRLGAIERARRERFPRMIRKLSNLGIDVSDEEVNDALRGVGSPGRPHLARILVEKEVVSDVQEAFDEYLAAGKPAYVKKERIDTIEAIRLLRDVAAVPVLAHPLIISSVSFPDLLKLLRGFGLEGVEVEYDYGELRTYGTARLLRKIAAEIGLIETGGSDYHGDSSHSQIGEVTVPVETIDRLRGVHKRLLKP